MSASLVIQTSFLGDMVLTTPLIAELSHRGPVDVVATPAAAGLLANHPSVRRVIIYDKRGADSGSLNFVRLAMRLRKEKYAAAYLAQGSVRSGALALLAGIPKRVGFASSAGRRFYTERALYIEGDHHAKRLLSLSGTTTGPIRPQLYPGATERQAVDALLGEHVNLPIFAIAPGSVWATKRWQGYVGLARFFASRGLVAVIGSKDDHELVHPIITAAGERVVDATGKLTLLASAELIRRSQLLVTNDSAPQHLASAVNTPTVTIFGPTVPQFGFGPLADRSTTVGIDTLACRPCDHHGPMKCPLGHWKCMREISAAAVVEAAEKMERW
jgi:heptosyltransferase-2